MENSQKELVPANDGQTCHMSAKEEERIRSEMRESGALESDIELAIAKIKELRARK